MNRAVVQGCTKNFLISWWSRNSTLDFHLTFHYHAECEFYRWDFVRLLKFKSHFRKECVWVTIKFARKTLMRKNADCVWVSVFVWLRHFLWKRKIWEWFYAAKLRSEIITGSCAINSNQLELPYIIVKILSTFSAPQSHDMPNRAKPNQASH